MKVILLKNISKLGVRGDIKDVKKGYAQNFLFPQKLAALPGTVSIKKTTPRQQPDIKNLISKFEGIALDFFQEANAQGKLYAAIDKKAVEAVLQKKGFKGTINSMNPDHLKNTGAKSVVLKVSGGADLKIKVNIKSK